MYKYLAVCVKTSIENNVFRERKKDRQRKREKESNRTRHFPFFFHHILASSIDIIFIRTLGPKTHYSIKNNNYRPKLQMHSCYEKGKNLKTKRTWKTSFMDT